MKLPWFRAYTEMVDDEKLKLLAFEDRWHFMALLCIKGQGLLDKDEAAALKLRKVAVKMGLDLRTLDEVARRLEEVGLIDRNTLQPVKWDDRQMRSDADPTSNERKRRQRERQKAAGSEAGKGDTEESRGTVTEVTRTEEDTDTDTEEDRNTSPAASRPATAEGDRQPSTFEQAWSAYPTRAGGNSRADACKAWKARVKAGADPVAMLAGVRRYAAFCVAENKVGTAYVKQAATFFGPGEHWTEDWKPSALPSQRNHGGSPNKYAAAAAAIFGSPESHGEDFIDV